MVEKICSQCRRPMISAGSVCGACNPPAIAFKQLEQHLDAPQKGRNGNYETFVDVSRFADVLEAPADKCFDFSVVHPDSWPILQTAVDTLKRIKECSYHRPSRQIGWETHQFGSMHEQMEGDRNWTPKVK